MYTIDLITSLSESSISDLNSLLHQLNPDILPIGRPHLEKLLSSGTTKVFGAFNEYKKLIGTITIALFPIPSGNRCCIEDVVVDKEHRGMGLGKALIEYVIAIAQENGVENIDLTSRPSRIEANQLYQKMGFELRETNVYRLKVMFKEH